MSTIISCGPNFWRNCPKKLHPIFIIFFPRIICTLIYYNYCLMKIQFIKRIFCLNVFIPSIQRTNSFYPQYHLPWATAVLSRWFSWCRLKLLFTVGTIACCENWRPSYLVLNSLFGSLLPGHHFLSKPCFDHFFHLCCPWRCSFRKGAH